MTRLTTRKRLIALTRQALEVRGTPRMQMTLLVLITGLAAFLASHLMLRAGVQHMGMRYLLATGVAWLVFMGLLWLWMRMEIEDVRHVDDAVDGIQSLRTDRWSETPELPGGGSRILENAADVDDGIIPLLLIAALLALLFAAGFIIYNAPILFAELIVDGVMAAGLYHRLRPEERQHWLTTAVRRTAAPFLATAMVALLTGLALSTWVPGARSIGDVLHRARSHQTSKTTALAVCQTFPQRT